MAVTIRSVQALRSGETVWDNAVKGFGCRRQLRDAVYVVKYRFFGAQRFYTIGRHGSPWTPEKARREALRVLGLVATGRDPQSEKDKARALAADSLGKVIEEYLAFASRKQKPRTYVETERHLRVNWRALHSASVHHLTRRQVAGHLKAIETKRGAVTAARARAALSAMFNWAIREGLDIAANPVAGTNRPTEPKSRSRVLTRAELTAVWRACRDDDYSRIVRVLMLTGQRRDEVGGMQWNEIDGDTWTIPGARTKNHRDHIVPLVPRVLRLLPDARKDRPYVFGNGVGFSGWSKSKAALDARLPISDWRLHDLRRTCATGMAELGVLPHIIEAVLNHVSGHRAGVAGVYNRARYEPEMRDALALWARHVEGLRP